jgi:hypothetical protein
MLTLILFILRINLQFYKGQVNNLLTEETPAGWGWLHLTLVTFSLRRNLQLEEGQVSNLLNEETHAGLGWLPQCSY